MASVGLPYVGAVLFVNAVMLLGRAEPRSVGIFNIFTGPSSRCFVPRG